MTPCGIVISSKKYILVFVLLAGTELLNPWGFLNVESLLTVFRYVHEVTLGEHLRMGLVASGANHVTTGWEFLVPLPRLWGWERGWRLTQSPVASGLPIMPM